MTYLPDIISPKAYLMAETKTIHFCLDIGKYIRYYYICNYVPKCAGLKRNK